jgi:aerobic carbon-monoxide dehydrogenase medium subunit
MIPAPFEYERAESLENAIELLARHGDDGKAIAGGHSLLPLMKLRLARPTALVDIDRLSELGYVSDAGDHIEIGALSRIGDLAGHPMLLEHNPLLAYACGQVGDPQVRHRATLGGAAAHGDPAGDPPSVLLALDAAMLVRGPEGDRTVPAASFFKDFFETDLGTADVLRAIRVPKLAPGTGWSYQKFHRRAIDWAIVGVAAVVELDDGHVKSARIGLTNMGLTPLRAWAVEAALAGSETSPEALRSAAEHAPEGTSPPADTNGSSEYRRELSKVLVRRAVEEALSR